MKTKQIFLLSAILLTALIFAGAGCDDKEKTAPPQDQSAAADVVVEEDVQEETADVEGEGAEDGEDEIDEVGEIDEFAGWGIYEQDGIILKYPGNWRVFNDGEGLYRWYEGVEEDFQNTKLGEFSYIVRGKLVTLYPVIEENTDGITLEEFWEEEKVNTDIKEKISVDGEPALTAECSGISYMECVLVLHNGKKINIVVDYMVDDEFVRSEVRQILETIKFE